MTIEVHPLTADRREDFERLFGPNGAYGGCWCMFPRITSREFEENGNAGNRAAMQAIIGEGRVPGLLAYDRGEPVGWVSVAPRSEFGRVERSRVTAPVDDSPAWAVVCFFVARDRRGAGVAAALLDAAMRYAGDQGAELLEAYPVDARSARIPAADAWHGTAAMFEAAGFETVARRRDQRPIMRRRLSGP